MSDIGLSRGTRTCAAALLALAAASGYAQAIHVELHSWYDPDRADQFATSEPVWRGSPGERRSPNYAFQRVEGLLFNPARAQPDGTVPLFRWYSPRRGDNLVTSMPVWRGSAGEVRPAGCVPERDDNCYRFVRLEGFVFDPSRPPPPGAIPLFGWFAAATGDNRATTDRRWAATVGAPEREGYRFVRREGYLLPPFAGARARVDVPVFFHLVREATDPATGLPAYGAPAETLLHVDADLAALNTRLDEARGLDSRRLRIVRAGVRYVDLRTLPVDWVARGCNADEAIGPGRQRGVLHMVLTARCGGHANMGQPGVSDVASLRHELGHILGLRHTFFDNRSAARGEPLQRVLEPTAPDSCYRRGDLLCDTPPDYGYARPDGSVVDVQCSGSGHADPLPFACEQVGRPCDPGEPMFDGRGLCTGTSTGGIRRYDATRLGLVAGGDAAVNAMSYAPGFPSGYFTHEQLLRMHGYMLWRRGQFASVPADEQLALLNDVRLLGPIPPEEHRSAEVRHFDARLVVSPVAVLRAGVLVRSFEVSDSTGRSTLAVRLEARGIGTPSRSARIRLVAPDGRFVDVTGAQLEAREGLLVVDDIRAAVPLARLRGAVAPGRWQVHVEDAAGTLQVQELRLAIVGGDGL